MTFMFHLSQVRRAVGMETTEAEMVELELHQADHGAAETQVRIERLENVTKTFVLKCWAL